MCILILAGGASAVPTPADPIIRRVAVPAQTVAVIRFENPATGPVVSQPLVT
jgi:hypothetical protein